LEEFKLAWTTSIYYAPRATWDGVAFDITVSPQDPKAPTSGAVSIKLEGEFSDYSTWTAQASTELH